MTKRFVAAAVAGMLTIALVGGLLYGVVFSDFFRSNIVAIEVMRNPPGFGWIALSHAPFGIVEPFIALVMVATAGAVVALVLARGQPTRPVAAERVI